MQKRKIYVAKNGRDDALGTRKNPLQTINKAASLAKPGDTVIVHEGVYREWVRPQHTGLSNTQRITYRAAEGEEVIIKGSERITEWELVKDSVWRVTLPNSYFGNFNPYMEEVNGDWILYETSERKHLGDVYLNGMSFYEVGTYEELLAPEVREKIVDNWTQLETPIICPEQTKYVWHAAVDDKRTTIYANFHNYNPNEELVEINVRKTVFYPDKTGVNYITVKGFELAHAATPWTPPTADQPGLIGANWSMGWIIEDNVIHDAKTSAISIGKEGLTGHNYYTNRRDKPGYQYQIESVFSALKSGWSRERIGSHTIRNNRIYDCGQNGIVGHLGCVFSEIYDNHIYNIGIKREFYGHEIGGIKLHAAIDVQIHDNRIHDCSLGLWLDWQTQGTRVSRNLMYRNNRDLFIEVSHGPYIVDHNIFASFAEMDNFSQGGAYINNLICGHIRHERVLDRATPYHDTHSTDVAGFAAIYGGDDRYFGNIFVDDGRVEQTGTSFFDGYTTSMEEYIEKVQEDAPGDHRLFNKINQPVYVNDNLYLNGAKAFNKEKNFIEVDNFNPEVEVHEEVKDIYLLIDLPKEFEEFRTQVRTTTSLPRPRIVAYDFDNPDGSALILNEDYLGAEQKELTTTGPIAAFKSGKNKIKVWNKI